MASERWQHVEQLYHAALAQSDEERAAFLRDACGGDDELREEVESLLTYDRDAQTFLAAAFAPSNWRAPQQMAPGQRFGSYEIVTFLGAGGMGDVYRAHDTRLRRHVAIKFLPDVFAEDSARRARFEREARLLASLNHPHVAAIYGFDDYDGVHALILELVEGETLAALISSGPLSIHQSLTIARQIADALDAAHSKGIVHRDLKPANIGMTRDGTVKVLDFGLAKSIVDDPDAAGAASSTADGGTHGVVGTASFMSPEQARGQPVDKRTDIWAFGCVLWAMLVGRAPFGGDTVSGTIAAILDREPSWEQLPSTLSDGIARLLRQCLEKDSSQRLGNIADALSEIDQALQSSPAARSRWWYSSYVVAGIGAGAITVAGVFAWYRTPSRGLEIVPTALTNFTDAAVAPAISPDGRMLAFIRADRTFLGQGQIYVKLLPNGEARQLTHDPRPKYGLAFSPDASKIAYTASVKQGFDTYTISPLGGEPTLMLANAGGMTWLDARRILFSEIKTGFHMGIVAADEDRSNNRELYFPQHKRSMAHYSYPSPDRRWALLVEMDYRPVWEQCRLIPLDGRSPGHLVGPAGPCSSAGWSPDGRWMYFTVEIGRESHLWRQGFPDGRPEQLTFGPAQEEGLAVAPDGSIITSIGTAQGALWIHDSQGDHQLSTEGDVVGRIGSYSMPVFSLDGRRLTYLRRESPASAPELWTTELATGRSELRLPAVGMDEYDISPDGTQIVFTIRRANTPSELWIGPMDRSTEPKRIGEGGEDAPFFAASGEILFRFTTGTVNYLGHMEPGGSARRRVVDYPIGTVQSISPDRRWLIAITPEPDGERTASMAIPTSGGAPRRICPGACANAWSPDGQSFYVQIQPSPQPGRMAILTVSGETGLPDLPPGGIETADQALSLRGVRVVVRGFVIPGPDPGTYAYINPTVHRNLFRIPAPR